jgi:transcriptional regulator GlxA family with amidase domain
VNQTVHLFVFDTLADWETGYAIAGINNLDAQTNPGRYQIKTVGLTTEPVTTIGGVKILPDLTLAEMEPDAMLILPGGEAWDEGKTLQKLTALKNRITTIDRKVEKY